MPWHDAEGASRPSGRAPQAAPAADGAAAPVWRAGHALYRLRRWPQARSLARHRRLPRLASLLMSRSLSLSGLAALSQVDEAECEAFLAELDRQGLLSRLTEDDAAPAPLPAGPSAAPVAEISASGTGGWLARLCNRWAGPR